MSCDDRGRQRDTALPSLCEAAAFSLPASSQPCPVHTVCLAWSDTYTHTQTHIHTPEYWPVQMCQRVCLTVSYVYIGLVRVMDVVFAVVCADL